MREATEAESGGSRDRVGLAAILLVAALVRALAWSRTAVLFNDGPVFLAMAEALGEGRWADVLAHPYHPLYPALIALVGVLPISLETAGVAVSIFGGLLTIAASFWFTRAYFGRDAAFAVAWVVTLHPWAVDFSSDVMSDGLYAGLFMLGFAAMARATSRPTRPIAALCGLAIGLAYAVRPEGAVLLFVALVLVAVPGLVDGSQRRQRVRGSAMLLVVALAVMASLVLAIGSQTGEYVLTQKKSVADWVGVESGKPASGTTSQAASVPLPLPEVAIRSDGRGRRMPTRDARGAGETLVRVAATSLSALRFELLPFVLLGCWALARRDPRIWLRWAFGLPLVLYHGLLLLLLWSEGYVSRRHALPPWLPLMALAVLGWKTLFDRLAPTRYRRAPLAFAVLAVVLVLAWGSRDLRPRRLDRLPVRLAAEWLAENHPDSGPVAAQKLRVAYYAGAPFVPLMPGLDGRLEAYLRKRGAAWVVIDASKLGDHQGLEEGIGRRYQPVHEISRAGRRILVLAVSKDP